MTSQLSPIESTPETQPASRDTYPVEYAAWTREQFSGPESEATPVIICARNEAEDLPITLLSLASSREPVLPIVVDNGSTDETAAMAHFMGAVVLEEPEAGKVAAFQTGIRFVRRELPHQNVVLATDADSRMHPAWSSSMSKKAQRLFQLGGVVFGLARVYGGDSRLTDNVRTTILNGKQLYSRLIHVHPGARGYNTAVTFDPHGNIERAILNMPNVFPGADRELRTAVMEAGGTAVASLSPYSIVATKGDRYSNLRQYISALRGKSSSQQVYQDDVVRLPAKKAACV